MSKETWDLIRRIANERNISIEILEEAVQSALISASKKMVDPEMEVVRADIDPKTGDYRVFARKMVVDHVENYALEISLPEARLYDVKARIGEPIEIDVTPTDFGRIAAQNAKQVITQRIREAEREMVFERYSNRIGELVSGTVQQYERGNVIVDIGYAEALLPFNEQSRGERYHYGDRIRAVILDVNQSSRDAQVILSRKTPDLVRKLFEQEVSEVRDGTVVIRGIAREPGKRSKIAVMSTNLDVDPVGACVGMKGSRVQMVVQELKGERIDIIPFSQDKAKFVMNSLKPAEVESVELDSAGKRATLVVKDDQLSLAIGKGGLNAKLASELTGVQVDIVSVSELEASERETRAMLASLPGVDHETVETLMSAGVFSYDDIVEYGLEGLTETAGLQPEMAAHVLDAAKSFVEGKETPAYLKSDGEAEN
ncbi:MAG: Transcription termination/antitermination protein NusA [bacterium]|nr:Transcription termination/antitermination protein NusA [bacterium]